MTRKKDMINVGFIGTGVISSLHARAYDKLDSAKLIAICDTDEKRMQKKAIEWNVDRQYTDYNALLDDKDIDAVEILSIPS
jgi:predicted dehydrogenase